MELKVPGLTWVTPLLNNLTSLGKYETFHVQCFMIFDMEVHVCDFY